MSVHILSGLLTCIDFSTPELATDLSGGAVIGLCEGSTISLSKGEESVHVTSSTSEILPVASVTVNSSSAAKLKKKGWNKFKHLFWDTFSGISARLHVFSVMDNRTSDLFKLFALMNFFFRIMSV